MKKRRTPDYLPRWGGWWTFPFRLLWTLGIWLVLISPIAVAIAIYELAEGVPDLPTLDILDPTYGLRVETTDGLHIGGALTTRPVPLHTLEPLIIGALLAAEDEDFFSHRGFSARGILRAALANYRAGEQVQGASTLTQQLAKQFVGSESTLDRKIHELLLARRLEATYSKPELLELYLNTVFFGRQSYGITQASWRYFDKPPTELELLETATLMGVLPAPSAFNPIDNPRAALRERNRVLRRMHDIGMIDEATMSALSERPIELRRGAPAFPMPEAVATVLRLADEHLGEDAWASSAGTIVVSHRPLMQEVARQSVRKGVLDHDKRQGWRGPISTVGEGADSEALDDALRAQSPARLLIARVTEVTRREARIITAGGEGVILLENARWAEPAATPRHYRRPVRLTDMRRALNVDEIILVVPIESDEDATPKRFALEQWPRFEGALIAIDTYTGEILASVGGFDSERSAFHRAEQGCRQPGSVFKTILFAEAIAQNFTAATMLSDVPHNFNTGEILENPEDAVYTPRNADRDFRGYLTLARALALSRNIPSVHLVEAVGPGSVVARAHRMGVESHLEPTLSVSLGSSCVRPIEMARVHAAFQRRGFTTDVSALAYVVDARGSIVRDFGHFSDPSSFPIERIARMSQPIEIPSQGLSEQVAYIMNHLLRDVTISGTAHMLPRAWRVGGKTGTSTSYDGWFVGFDGRTTLVTWLGSDRNTHDLGPGEHGATVALPMFQTFMADLDLARTDNDWPGPAPENIVFARIDATTGFLSRPGEAGVSHPFIQGTEPTELAPSKGTRQAEEIDSLLMDF